MAVAVIEGEMKRDIGCLTVFTSMLKIRNLPQKDICFTMDLA